MPATTRSRTAAASLSFANPVENAQNPSAPTDTKGLLPLRDQLPDAPKRKKKAKSPVSLSTLLDGIPESLVVDDRSPEEAQTGFRSLGPPDVPQLVCLETKPISATDSIDCISASLPPPLVIVEPVVSASFSRKSLRLRPKPTQTSLLTSVPTSAAAAHHAKHSLRLVRGLTSSSWTVVTPIPHLLGTSSKTVSGTQDLPSTPPAPKLLSAVWNSKPRAKPNGIAAAAAKRSRTVPGKKKAAARTKRNKKKPTGDSFGSGSTTTTDADSFRSDYDGEGTSSGSFQDSQPSVSPADGEGSVAPEEPVGLGPVFSLAQKEALSKVYKGDVVSAGRYIALKEWVFDRGTKLFHGGVLKNKLRDVFTECLDGIQGTRLDVAGFEKARNAVRTRAGELDLDDFKRLLCLEIIKSRNPQYGSGKPSVPMAGGVSSSQ